jgi:hypothetical protein
MEKKIQITLLSSQRLAFYSTSKITFNGVLMCIKYTVQMESEEGEYELYKEEKTNTWNDFLNDIDDSYSESDNAVYKETITEIKNAIDKKEKILLQQEKVKKYRVKNHF